MWLYSTLCCCLFDEDIFERMELLWTILFVLVFMKIYWIIWCIKGMLHLWKYEWVIYVEEI